jgi:hypothetical protein
VTVISRALSRCRNTHAHAYTAIPDIEDDMDDDNDNCGYVYEPDSDAASLRHVTFDPMKSSIHALDNDNDTLHSADTISEVSSSIVPFLDVKQYLYGSPSPIDDTINYNSCTSCKSV